VRCTHLDVCFTSIVILVILAKVDFAGVAPETWKSTGAFSRLRMMAGDAALVGTGRDRAEATMARAVGCWGES